MAQNVVVDEKYRVKLIDFGSASRIPKDSSKYFDRFSGTLHFASPEILRGKPYRGPEADIWALGVLLYTILFNETPYRSLDDIVRNDIRLPIEPLRKFLHTNGLIYETITSTYTNM